MQTKKDRPKLGNTLHGVSGREPGTAVEMRYKKTKALAPHFTSNWDTEKVKFKNISQNIEISTFQEKAEMEI